jgi:hypothetical protein
MVKSIQELSQKIKSPLVDGVTYTSNTLTIPNQYNPIAHYLVTLPNAGDTIDAINFGIFPSGYQAIIMVDGTNGTVGAPCMISHTITNVNTNLGAPGLHLAKDLTNGYATMTIYNFGIQKLCNVVGYNN